MELEVALVPPGTYCGAVLAIPDWPYVKTCTTKAAGELKQEDWQALHDLTGYLDGPQMCNEHLSDAASALGKTWPAKGA